VEERVISESSRGTWACVKPDSDGVTNREGVVTPEIIKLVTLATAPRHP
jgi:hypothetical protein